MQHDYLIIWCHWHWCQCHIMPTASSVSTAVLRPRQLKWGTIWLFFIMWCYWHQHWHCMMALALVLVSYNVTALVKYHVMWTAPPMVPLHSLGQVDQNNVQHDFLVMWHHWHQPWHHEMLIVLSQHHCIS